jgi:hydrogenase-4 component F
MGLAALGAAVGTRLAAASLLLHILGHGLAKAVAFTSAGQILHHTKTSRIAGVRGLATTKPALAGVFGLAVAALAGLPPFPLFASELGIARSAVSAGLGWVLAVAMALLLVIFAALARHATAMLLGPTPGPGPTTETVLARGAVMPLVLALTAAAVLGTVLGPLQPLLRAAATIVGAP